MSERRAGAGGDRAESSAGAASASACARRGRRGGARREGLGRLVAVGAPLIVAVAVLTTAATAAAQARGSGAVGLIGLFHDERSASDGRSASRAVERIDFGGGAIADIGVRFGPLRVGGALGLAAVTSADGVRSRVYMPLAASLGLTIAADPIELEVRARAGLWGGATDLGLRADLWASGGLLLGFDLGGGARAQLGIDVWLQRAEVSSATGNTTGVAVYYGPVLGLSWDAPAEPQAADDDDVNDGAAPDASAPDASAPAQPTPLEDPGAAPPGAAGSRRPARTRSFSS